MAHNLPTALLAEHLRPKDKTHPFDLICETHNIEHRLDCARKVGHSIMNLCSSNEGYKHDKQNKNIPRMCNSSLKI